MRRTEGWARASAWPRSPWNGSRPGRFVKELITEDSAVTGYLVEEVLKGASPEVREVLPSTSILK